MSLVGPRPAFKEEIIKYYKDYAIYYYKVLPGITGLWQISGRSNTSIFQRVELDVWYVKNWNLWLDIVILIKTIKVVLKREGAY
jgi:undecaprenyl-phosphate galactose phosphotransferase